MSVTQKVKILYWEKEIKFQKIAVMQSIFFYWLLWLISISSLRSSQILVRKMTKKRQKKIWLKTNSKKNWKKKSWNLTAKLKEWTEEQMNSTNTTSMAHHTASRIFPSFHFCFHSSFRIRWTKLQFVYLFICLFTCFFFFFFLCRFCFCLAQKSVRCFKDEQKNEIRGKKKGRRGGGRVVRKKRALYQQHDNMQ